MCKILHIHSSNFAQKYENQILPAATTTGQLFFTGSVRRDQLNEAQILMLTFLLQVPPSIPTFIITETFLKATKSQTHSCRNICLVLFVRMDHVLFYLERTVTCNLMNFNYCTINTLQLKRSSLQQRGNATLQCCNRPK